jgi:hypothetical protein
MNHRPVAIVDLKRRGPLSRHLFKYATNDGYKYRSDVRSLSLSLTQLITLSLSKLSLLQRMASNDNSKRKLEEEAESSTVRKRLRISDDDVGDDDSSDSPEEETEEEEVSSEETSMKQLDTSEGKLFAKYGHDTTSPSSEPLTPESHWCSDEDSSDEDDDDDDF